MKALIALTVAILALVGLAGEQSSEAKVSLNDGESDLKGGISSEDLVKSLDGDRFQEQYPLLAGTSFVREK